ncbi:MAG: AmmeMemoRadiSam system radical SAM enzyme [Candidatus Dadabacteria bacterium]
MAIKKEIKTLARPSLARVLDECSEEGELYQKLGNKRVLCYACGHRCIIYDGLRGICKVRYNRDGRLFVPKGYVAALQCDPTEKKPFFHVLPGSFTLTFGMLGCDYHCAYCQNWLTSQTLRDSSAGIEPMMVTARQMIAIAKRYGASMVGSSYNEPLITAEWAADVFRLAKEQGFKTAFISNGNATREVLEYLRPITDCYKVDLKSMQDRNYRKLGGLLSTVLETIPRLVDMGFWVEIVTLIIPGFNDSDEELKSAAKFLASVSPDIPWHVTAFHKDYKMTNPDNTSPKTLIRAAEMGYEAGLRFVYAGNLPGWVKNYENTYCPNCHKLLVERYGYKVLDYRITPDGRCPYCSTTIPGIWW